MKKNVFFWLAIFFVFPSISIASFMEGEVTSATAELYPDPTVVHLPCGIDLDTHGPKIPLAADLLLSGPEEGVGTWLVQFEGPIYEQERTALEAAGAVVEGYLPNYTYLVRMDQSTRTRAMQLEGVRWIGAYHPGYKICPEIDLESGVPQEFVILIYRDATTESFLKATESMGARTVGWEATSAETVVHLVLAPARIPELVRLSEVKWIEPYHEPYLMNGNAQWVVQTWKQDNRRIWDKGLKGQGQILNVLDSGIRTTHNFFRDPAVPITAFGDYPDHRKIIAYQPTQLAGPTFGDDYVIGHGTHTTGSVLGNDRPVGGSSVNIGMAPEAKIYFLDGGSNSNPGGLIIGMDLEAVIVRAYKGNSAGGARISSHSWGSQSTRAYDGQCVQADRTMWNRPDYLVFFSGGNTDRGYYTGSPGNAKNVVCVGASKNSVLANLTADFSSSGPSGDGRIRPDIVVPGEIVSSRSTSDVAEIAYYGTSMSCPVAAGNTALIRQYFTEGWYPSGTPQSFKKFTPSAALLKAMLINSVETDYFNRDVPDPKVGWGRPMLDNVLYFPGESRNLIIGDQKPGLKTGQQFETLIKVDAATEPLRVTLVWTDYPGQSYASPALVNDLDLEVVSPASKTYRGNNFSDNASIEGGNFDNLNPVENVFVNSPATGNWTIRVRANNVPQGPQPFALVVTCKGSGLGIEENTLAPKQSYDLEVASLQPGDLSIRFNMPHAGNLRLELWDAAGRRIQTLYNGYAAQGTQTLSRQTKDLASGSYFITLSTQSTTRTAKAVVIH